MSRALHLLVPVHVLVLVLGFSAGCPRGNGNADGGLDAGPDAGVDAGIPCTDRTGCEDGRVCVEGFCEDCLRDRQCLGTELCNPVIHRCEFIPCFGGDCEAHGDCALGEFCVQGLCRLPAGDPECGTVRACGNDTDCEADERCNEQTLVCELDTGCFSDGACAAGTYCDLGTNTCRQACTAETELEICPDAWNCVSGRCVECSADADCGTGLTCDLLAGRCAAQATCFTDRDCVRPLVCNRATGQCTDEPPPCVSNDDCLPTEVCEIRSGLCVDAECLPDALEPNDLISEAAPVSPGLISNLTLCNQEDDHYLVSLGAGDRVSLTVNPPALSGSNYSARAFDPTGTSVIATGNLQLDFIAAVTGDHPLLVTATDLRGTYSIQLLVSRGIPCEDDGNEPNDGFTAATLLQPGSLFNLQRCASNDDWYEVLLERGRSGTVRLQHDPLEGDLDLSVFDSDGVTLLGRSATADPEEVVNLTTTSAGRAFIQVTGSARSEAAYDLEWVIQ
ncbi:MAG: PPC domain-containing protein [Deltaproteobacteria bacterium]|nr:PPC domain-containing protein [Deltaproteobacteria bacterium]